VATEWQAQHSGRCFWRRGWTRSHHAGGRICQPHVCAIGLIAGVVCYLMVAQVKSRLGYDDSLDAFGVHGVGGTIGAILTGVFASRAINPIFKDAQANITGLGVIDGNAGQLLNQFVGVVIGWVLAAVGTLVILKVVDLVIGLRVLEGHEIQGLDLSQHGEEGYNFEVSA